MAKQEVYQDLEKIPSTIPDILDVVSVTATIHEDCHIGNGNYEITFKGEKVVMIGNTFIYYCYPYSSEILHCLEPKQITSIKIKI